MDLETRQYLNEHMSKAVEDMKRVRTPEEIARSERIFAQIRANGAAALERLEKYGGVQINYCR